MTIHRAVPNRPHHHVATSSTAKPASRPTPGLDQPRPRHDAFNPKPANRPAVPEGWATIMPITTPDAAKATPVLRYEAKQARMGLISAAMRGDTAGMMKCGQRLGQLQQTLEARGAQMFPSNALSLANYVEGFSQLNDNQMLGERSDHFQQLLVGGLQLNNSAVSNATQRLGAVQDEIDSRGGLGLGALGDLFSSLPDADLTGLVGGLLGGSSGGDLGSSLMGLLNPLGGLLGGGGAQEGSESGGVDVGNVLGNILNPLGGLFGGGGAQQEQGSGGGVDVGNVLMGFLNPVGALLGGGSGGQDGGVDRMINGAASGLMEMATRGIGGVFQNVFGGLFS